MTTSNGWPDGHNIANRYGMGGISVKMKTQKAIHPPLKHSPAQTFFTQRIIRCRRRLPGEKICFCHIPSCLEPHHCMPQYGKVRPEALHIQL